MLVSVRVFESTLAWLTVRGNGHPGRAAREILEAAQVLEAEGETVK